MRCRGGLAGALAETVATHGAKVALRDGTRSITYRALLDAVHAASRVIVERWEVEPGDRVAYLGFNRIDELVLLFACARTGAILVPLNTRLTVVELAGIATQAGLRALVTDADHREVGAAVIAVAGNACDPIASRSIDDLSGVDCDPDVDSTPANDDTPLLLVYTSGTSGAPKGALHTHRGLLANAAAAVTAHDLTANDRVLSVLPLFHVGGLCIQTLPALLTGASVALHPRFEAGSWLDAIETFRPTLSLLVPATLRAVIAHPGWSRAPLSCLRVLMTGSSIIPRSLIDAVHARGVPMGQIYGSTETGPVTVALKAGDAVRKAGFAGWPCFPGSVRLIDATDGGVGEIVVRAPNLMQGYWRNTASSAFDDDGWFATGDLGRFDDEGCLAVVGRVRDLIISGGENVYPTEVEEVLLGVDGVAEVAVIGRADERWGEVPVAFVVRDGSCDPVDLAVRIASRLGTHLARFKHPARIVHVDRLPRNAMGKVQGHLLREHLARDTATATAPG